MASRVDAVVVGGGPAGALAALQLSRMSWRVILIERGPRNRNKTCGHCLNPRGFGPLERAGVLEEVQQLAVGETRRFTVHIADSPPMHATLRGADTSDFNGGLVVERSHFDQLLIDHAASAGVEVLQPATARIIGHNANESIIQVVHGGARSEWRTRLVIGADGVGSAVARSAGFVNRNTAGRKFGFSFDAIVPHDDAVDPETIAMFVGDSGYLGVVRQGGSHVHAAVLASSHSNRRDVNANDPAAVVRDVAAHHNSLRSIGWDEITRSQMRQFTAIGPMPWRPNAVATERVALIGDAAGYIEPFTGEGMTWALHSAEVLTEVLQDVQPGVWNRNVAQCYQHEWQAMIGRQQRFSRAVAQGMQRPRVARWMVRAGARFPSVTRHVIQRVMAT